MKKKLFIFILLLILIPLKIDAARIPCTKKNLNKLKSQAYSVKLSYELVNNKESGNYVRVNVSDIPDGLEVRYGGISYYYDEEKPIQEVISHTYGGETYSFDIYVEPNQHVACVGEKLITKSITVPKYNPFSEREECIEYEEFPLCNKWYKGKIEDDLYFNEELDKYIKSLKKPEPVDPAEKIGFYDKVVEFVQDHIVLISVVIALIVIGIIYLIVRAIIRKKNRVRIDL